MGRTSTLSKIVHLLSILMVILLVKNLFDFLKINLNENNFKNMYLI